MRRGRALLAAGAASLALAGCERATLGPEVERGRQLQAGIAAESELQLPARDTRNIEKSAEKEEEDAAHGRSIRLRAGRRRR